MLPSLLYTATTAIAIRPPCLEPRCSVCSVTGPRSSSTIGAATPSWDVIFPALPVALLIGLIYRNVPLSVPAGFVGGLLLYGIVFVLAGGVRPHERAWLAANLPEGTVRRVCRHLRLLDEKTHGDGSIPIDITENADARRP